MPNELFDQLDLREEPVVPADPAIRTTRRPGALLYLSARRHRDSGPPALASAATASAASTAPSAACSAVTPPCKYTSYGSRSGASHESSIVAPLTNEPLDMITGST